MSVPRYQRVSEPTGAAAAPDTGRSLRPHELERGLASSELTAGARDLVRGLCRLARPAVFPGGGLGLEYASLLKSSVNPAYLREHIRESAAHLREQRVDLLVVPGMSGYPIGSMYAVAADLPAILLTKKPVVDGERADHPTGCFIVSSYTGGGDVLMSADLAAMRDVVTQTLLAQVEAQAGAGALRLCLRIAGADDIIDKATMSRAVSECSLGVGEQLAEEFLAGYRAESGDTRAADVRVVIAAWVTPLVKEYNRPRQYLRGRFGVTPFAGVGLTGVRVDPPAIGIAGLGTVELG